MVRYLRSPHLNVALRRNFYLVDGSHLVYKDEVRSRNCRRAPCAQLRGPAEQMEIT